MVERRSHSHHSITAILLARHFGSLQKIKEASVEELSLIEGIGEVIAQAIYDWFKNANNQKLLKKLLARVTITEHSVIAKTKKLTAEVIVFTGTLPTLEREAAKNLARAAGAKISSSVGKNTTLVVAGENAGSKLTEAEKLGVKVISEADFLKLIK